MQHAESGPIKASEVLDAPLGAWSTRPWTTRRELAPGEEAFCDEAASMALAALSRIPGARMPTEQLFLSKGGIQAWRGSFPWGEAWCASRDGFFFAWARGDAVADARAEVSGPQSHWDGGLAEWFAENLAAGRVERDGW